MQKSITRNTTYALLFAALWVNSGCAKKDESGANAQPKPEQNQAKPAGGPAPADKPKGLPVKAQPVKVAQIDAEVSAVGTLLADESVIIRPEIAGRVVGLHFKEGQAVRKGTTLVTIDPSEYQAQLAATSADAKIETQRHERTKELLDKKFISQEALDVAQGNMDRALARRRHDEVMVAKTNIRAPFDGILGLRQISPGAYVKEGEDIVRLENIAALKLDFRVPEMYVSKLKQNQTVAVRVDSYPGENFEGRIYAIEPNLDEKTRTVVARAHVSNNHGKLRPGMFARVNVLLETRPNSILVPEQAIWPQGQDSFVYTVTDGKVALVKVEIGMRRPGEVEIVQGLSADDMVVTEGQVKLKDGVPVTVLPSQPPAAAAGAGAPKAGG